MSPSTPQFTDRDLAGARFERCDLSGAVLRAVHVDGMEIDAPWLSEGEHGLVVNGVDVAAYVDSELDRRFPGRSLRTATDPGGLREAWVAVEAAWAAAVARATAMPPGTLEASVDGEWSFTQTLRHLVMATDVWLRQSVLGLEQALSPLGQPHAEYATDGFDTSVFSHPDPSWDEVLEVRADRQAQVTAFLASVDATTLAQPRPHPWAPPGSGVSEPVLACLHTILGEEWEHLRFALRDLDALDRSGEQPQGRTGAPATRG